MKRTAVEIYALSVCFVSVFALVLNLAQAVYAIVAIYAPEITTKRDFETRATLTNDTYLKWITGSGEKAQQARPTDEDLTKRRLELRAERLSEESAEGKGHLVNAVIYFLCFAIALAIHWNLAKRMRNESLPPVA